MPPLHEQGLALLHQKAGQLGLAGSHSGLQTPRQYAQPPQHAAPSYEAETAAALALASPVRSHHQAYGQPQGGTPAATRPLGGHVHQKWPLEAAHEFGTTVDEVLDAFGYTPQLAAEGSPLAFGPRPPSRETRKLPAVPVGRRVHLEAPYRPRRRGLPERIGDTLALSSALALLLVEESIASAFRAPGRIFSRLTRRFQLPRHHVDRTQRHEPLEAAAIVASWHTNDRKLDTPPAYLLPILPTPPLEPLFTAADIDRFDTMLFQACRPNAESQPGVSSDPKWRTVGSYWRGRSTPARSSSPSHSSPVWNGGVTVGANRARELNAALARRPLPQLTANVDRGESRLARYEYKANGTWQSETFTGVGEAFLGTVTAWLLTQPEARLVEDRLLPGPPELTRYRNG